MITYDMIYAASNGDFEAMNRIIQQYRAYIDILSTKKIKNVGSTDFDIDIDLRDLLISKIIDLTLDFNPYPKYREEME